MLINRIFFLFLLFPLITFGQAKVELGGGIGAFNYTGDLSRNIKITSSRPGITGHFKYNLSKATSFRASLTAGWISGTDAKPDDAFSAMRGRSFRVVAVEAATTFEYDFIDMKGDNKLVYGSPYLFGGFGITNIIGQVNASQAYSPIQPILPIGFGGKYVVTPNWYISLEFGARFTFFDYLDGISYGDPNSKDYQYGQWFDNDMYYFISLSATYSFFKIQCPVNPY